MIWLRLTAAALLWAAAGRAVATDTPAVRFDLVERFPAAVARVDTTLIRFTAPEAATLLISGFAREGGGPKGPPFLWGTGDHSELRFFVSEPRALPLAFRCWPLRFKDAPEQRVTVAVNGLDVGEVSLRQQPSRYELTIPARALRPGENRLTLRYAFSRSRQDLSPKSTSTRQLAVAWDWMQFGDGAPVGQPSVVRTDTRSSLILPPGTGVDYYTRLPAGSTLVIEDVLPLGVDKPAPADLRVEMQPASAAKSSALTVPRSGRRVVSLPAAPGEVVKLSFRVPKDGGSGESGIEVVRPAIYAPAKVEDGAVRPHPAAGTHPNVIVYLVDALRADHLGCYGYAKATSPFIDAFAHDAVSFTRALAQASATRPAVASIFTGLDPRRHGVAGKDLGLPPAAVTLAELLQQAGYETAGFVTNGNVSPSLGFGQGFDVYEYLAEEQTPEVHQLSDRLNARVFDWLDHRRGGRPFFLYVHSTDPHAPYVPRSPYRERFAGDASLDTLNLLGQSLAALPASYRDQVMALYDAEIAFNDASFGELLGRLRALGLYDKSVIVFMADHGEEFQEHHHWEHAKTLYDEVLHIPLIIRVPGALEPSKVVTQTVAQIDLLPTVLDLLQLPPATGAVGRSLVPLIAGDPGMVQEVPVFAALGERARFESVVDGRFKLIRDAHALPGLQVYDLARDPQEVGNVTGEQPIMTEYLYALVRASRPAANLRLPAARGSLDEKTAERLRALGYQP